MRQIAWIVAAVAICLSGCGSDEPTTAVAATEVDEVVLTTFYPTAYFAERIGGGLVSVRCPVPDGEDPIFWQPSREAMAEYRRARLIILNGADFEKWAATAALPRSRVVDSAAGFADSFLRYKNATTHSHGPAGEHSHQGVDSHTWLDPNNATRQGEAIAAGMARAWPEHAEAFESGLAALTEDLISLDARLSELTPRVERVALLASHPAYNYITARYGWAVVNLDLDPAESIGGETLDEIGQAIGGDAAGVLLWESEPTIEAVEVLRSIGVESVVFSPAELLGSAAREQGEDYLSIMLGNVTRLSEALPPE